MTKDFQLWGKQYKGESWLRSTQDLWYFEVGFDHNSPVIRVVIEIWGVRGGSESQKWEKQMWRRTVDPEEWQQWYLLWLTGRKKGEKEWEWTCRVYPGFHGFTRGFTGDSQILMIWKCGI